MKKFLKVLLCIVLVLIIAVLSFFLYLTATEYRPDDVTALEVRGEAFDAAPVGQEIKIISWNIGYCGLGAESDFFMDGGKEVQAADKDTVQRYLTGINSYIDYEAPEIVMLQEVDTDSQRSYGIDQTQTLARDNSVHALNYSCNYVPFPMPPIGKVHSGLFTTTQYAIENADRISLPCPFSWPVRTANLKRCLMASYIPVEGSDNYLVMVNLHLEAYDSGEGKIAQTKQLREFIASEYEKGNYVIAGGDFNQRFPGSADMYALNHPELWTPGELEYSALPEGFIFAYDAETPTCRLLNQPYNPADEANTDYYVIDGFIVSPNVQVSEVTTADLSFRNSDHNPIRLVVTLLDGEES